MVIVYYTDRLGDLFLDQLTGLEYIISEDYLWVSEEAGETLIRTIGPLPSGVMMRKRNKDT